MGPGWQNRPIDEKPKVQPHERSPYSRPALAHWRDVLTRTLPGRITVLFGAVILLGALTATIGHFVVGAHPSYGEALWRSLTHMIDPGSLGDDDTVGERAIGVIQVLIGIVFLAGVVLTVLTEVVDRALLRLQRGDPALRVSGHLLVIGMNDTLGEVRGMLTETLEGERPPIVAMLPPAQDDRRQAARRALAGYPGKVHVVVADPRSDGFDRVCAGDARHIVVLSPDAPPDRSDLEVTGVAMLLARHLSSVDAAPPVAVELRRGRNVDALWFDPGHGQGKPAPRFPASFDALVNDRTIGALLSLVVLNPHFSRVFLTQDDGVTGPELMAADGSAGSTFGEVRDRLEGSSLLGLLTGTGATSQALYLPPSDRRISAGDRLIVIRDESGRMGASSGPDPESVKVAPARPGPLLVLGFSDSAAALLDALDQPGLEPGRITVLAPADPFGRSDSRLAIEVTWVEGDPGDPQDIAHAIERADPAVVFAAAAPDREAEAVVSGRFARQQTSVPIVVEQQAAVHDPLDLDSDQITVVSTSTMTAEAVALSLADPALVVAREGMVTDPGIVLESLTYTGSQPLALRDLPAIFGRAGYYPLAVSLTDESGGLAHGDHILAMQRIRRA